MCVKMKKNRPVVIKYGGSVLKNKEKQNIFLKQVVSLHRKMPVVLVHGGGSEVTDMLARLGVKTRFVNGLRYTDEKTMEIVEMVLCGKVNKRLVAQLNVLDGQAVGISGKDGNMVIGKRVKKLGQVGQPDKTETKLIESLLDSGFLPVISSVGVDKNGVSLNFNADTLAGELAIKMKAKKLIFLTDVPGVLNKNGRVIGTLHVNNIDNLIHEGTIKTGMVPKLKSCVEAIRNGVGEVVITDGMKGLAEGTIIVR